MCRYGIAPVSTRPRRKPRGVSSTSTQNIPQESIKYAVQQPQQIIIPVSSSSPEVTPQASYMPTYSVDPVQSVAIPTYNAANSSLVHVSDFQMNIEAGPPIQDEREKLHSELQSLAQILDNLHQKLQPTSEKSIKSEPLSGNPVVSELDPIFLRDSLWRPPAVPTLYAAAGIKPSRGQIMTLDTNNSEESFSLSSSLKGKKRKAVRKFYPRALKGTTVGYSESELVNLQFAKDLLAYFGGDFNNVSVGQHAQCVVYRDFIVYVNREFIDLMRSPYENIIGRSMDDFVPEAFLQYHNHMFHRELVVSGSSTIAFETVMARLDRTCFKCVFGMSLMKNADNKLVQKICTIYLNTIQEVEVPPGKTPVPYFETDYARKVEYETAPEPCKNSSKSDVDEARFPLYFAKACFEAKQIRESRLTARRTKGLSSANSANAASSQSTSDR